MRKLSLALVALVAIAAAAPHAEAQNFFYKAALTSAVTVQGSSFARVYGYYISNTNASVCSLDIFTTFPVVLGTTVPVASFPIPATAAANIWIQGGAPVPNSGTGSLSFAAVTAPGGGTPCGTGMTVDFWYQ